MKITKKSKRNIKNLNQLILIDKKFFYEKN